MTTIFEWMLPFVLITIMTGFALGGIQIKRTGVCLPMGVDDQVDVIEMENMDVAL